MSKSVDEFGRNMLSSGLAGGVGMLHFNPLDCLRVRWQVSTEDARKAGTITRFAREIVAREGFWLGLWSPALGCNMAAVTICNSLRFSW